MKPYKILNTSLFRALASETVVDCTLDNGTTTECHQLAFNVNEVRNANGKHGHTSATSDYPDGVYHCHASLDAPSLPPCVVGVSVVQRQSPGIR